MPAGPGADQQLDGFFEIILVTYNSFIKKLGGVEAKLRQGKVFKPRKGVKINGRLILTRVILSF